MPLTAASALLTVLRVSTSPFAVDAGSEVADEQAYIDHAYECLARMRDRAIHLLSLGYPGEGTWADVKQWELDTQARIDSMSADSPTALCFGRIDESSGERFYIGRRHVEDRAADPVVVDWRAPVATAFYRATVADAMGLRLRRRFLLEDRTLLDVLDEDLEHPDERSAGAYVPDPLLAEISRVRTGEMRDIVATIQAEQDVIIRAPIERCIVVQGGPGTGKTAVGLHRAAFLLYEHRELLLRQRLLIIGPNPIFLRYISQVLPSLGETASVQLTLEGLAGARYRVGLQETREVTAIKGDARMVEVVRRAVLDQLGEPAEDLDIVTRFGTVTLAAADLQGLFRRARQRSRFINPGRNALRAQLIAQAWAVYSERDSADVSQRPSLEADARSSPALKAVLDRHWPAMTPSRLLRRLYADAAALDRAAEGVLTPAERALLARRPSRRASEQTWGHGDLALLDEAEALLDGMPQTYGHVVVDEAQDLSAMELRMLARRSRKASMTILGDLAQATAPGAQTNWSDAIGHVVSDADLAAQAEPEVEELTVGYRVPAPIMDFANRLLPVAAPGVTAAPSVRASGQAPRLEAVEADRRGPATAAAVAELSDRYRTVAVVTPDSLRDEVVKALADQGIEFLDGQAAAALGERVTLLSPMATKGLEFDAVVAVEPALIAGGELNGARLLYVVLTRAVQELVVIHAEALPSALAS